MCIVFAYAPPHSDASPFALIVAANRDEYLARPTLTASWNDFDDIKQARQQRPQDIVPRIVSRDESESTSSDAHGNSANCLCGRDAQDPIGGTWLGLSIAHTDETLMSGGTRTLRLGALTNIHDEGPVHKPKLSRGALVKTYLQSPTGTPDAPATRSFLDNLAHRKNEFAGFNLLLFDVCFPSEPHSAPQTSTYYFSNRSPELSESKDATLPMDLQGQPTFGMSNSILSEPYNKVTTGVQVMKSILERVLKKSTDVEEDMNEKLVTELFNLLGQHKPVNVYKDLESSISVPLSHMPISTAAPIPSKPPNVAHDSPSGHPLNDHKNVYNTPISSPRLGHQAPADDKPNVPPTVPEDPKPPRPYATRLSTVVLVRKDGRVVFIERDRVWMDKSGKDQAEVIKQGGTPDRRFEFRG